MSVSRQHFLDKHLPLPGVVACAIRLPDRTAITRRDGDALTTAQVEHLLDRLALVIEGLKRHKMEAQCLCWTFDQARIHLTRHPDGTTLAVFSEKQPGQPANEEAWHLLQAFHELTGD